MIDFYLAPWKLYKGVLAAAVLAAPFGYYAAWSSLPAHSAQSSSLTFTVIRIAIPWLVGWFLILFGDGAYGSLFPRSLRSYYVMLGILILILPTVRAWAYYDRDSIRSVR